MSTSPKRKRAPQRQRGARSAKNKRSYNTVGFERQLQNVAAQHGRKEAAR